MKSDTKALERIFKALANRRRLEILRVLKSGKKISVGDIAHEIKLSFKATSKHLGILYGVGFIDKEQESLMIRYFLHDSYPQLMKTVLTHL